MNIRKQLKLINIFSVTQVGYFTYLLLNSTETCKSYVFALLFFGSTSAASYAILKKKSSPFHTWKSLLIRTLLQVVINLGLPRRIYKQNFENPSKQDLQEIQKKALFKVLKDLKDTKYAKDMKTAEIKSVEEYRSKIPINTFWTMEKYMAMSYRGEKDVTIRGTVDYLAKSSGTTGKNKAYPINRQTMEHFRGAMFSIQYVAGKFFPRYTLNKYLSIRVFSPKRYNEHGIPVGPISQSMEIPALYELQTIPYEALKEVFDEETIMYINAVFSLREMYIDQIDCFFPSHILSFSRCMEKHWESMCNDIENGELLQHLEISPELRTKLNSKLIKQPERAEFLRCEFRKGMKNIIKRIWPEMNFIHVINSGTFKSSFDYVKNQYLQDLDAYSAMLLSTESVVGINLDGPNTDPPLYTIIPTSTFFEFISEDQLHEEHPKTVLLHEVKFDTTYEIVVTNHNGLYRHRIGDCVKFVKYFGSIPVCEMLYRMAHCLNVKAERVDEVNFQKAIRQSFEKMEDKILVEYTATEYLYFNQLLGNNVDNDRYVIFVELKYKNNSRLTLEEKKSIDDELINTHENYRLYRADNRIKPMEIYELKSGAFAALKEFTTENYPDTSKQQYKLPRVISNLKLLQVIKDQFLE